MMRSVLLVILSLVAFVVFPKAQAPASTRVGPARGAVFSVGGGAAPDVLGRFIEEAGGPDAFILTVPTAATGSNDATTPDMGVAPLRAAGAKNVQVLHTDDRAVADTERFVEPITRAAAVWFGGGAPERIIAAYKGTRAEREFQRVLERGGVLGGTSAGAVALASVFVPSMLGSDRSPRPALGFLRGVSFEPHTRVPGPKAWMSDRPELLHLAADEPTAWLIRGDEAEIVGRGKAYVYRRDAANPGVPFVTLRPGDRMNLASGGIRRAAEGTAISQAFVDSLVAEVAKSKSTATALLVSHQGKILVDKSATQRFALAGLSNAFLSIAAQQLAADGKMRVADLPSDRRELARRLGPLADMGLPPAIIQGMGWGTPFGAFLAVRASVSRDMIPSDLTTGEFHGDADALYLWEAGLEQPRLFPAGPPPLLYLGEKVPERSGPVTPPDPTFGWTADTYRGAARLSLFGLSNGRRHAWMRIPTRRLSVIVLTDSDETDARSLAERIIDRLP